MKNDLCVLPVPTKAIASMIAFGTISPAAQLEFLT